MVSQEKLPSAHKCFQGGMRDTPLNSPGVPDTSTKRCGWETFLRHQLDGDTAAPDAPFAADGSGGRDPIPTTPLDFRPGGDAYRAGR